MRCNVRKYGMHLAKIQVTVSMSTSWSESVLSVLWVGKYQSLIQVDSEDPLHQIRRFFHLQSIHIFICKVFIFSSAKYSYFHQQSIHIFISKVFIFSSAKYSYLHLQSIHIFICKVFIFFFFSMRHFPANTWRLYNVGSTSMQRHDVASTLRRHCINVICPLGSNEYQQYGILWRSKKNIIMIPLSTLAMLQEELRVCWEYIWANVRQNQQNDICARQRCRSAWATTQSDQSSQTAWRKLGSLSIHWVDSKDWSDLLVLSCIGSYHKFSCKLHHDKIWKKKKKKKNCKVIFTKITFA